MRSETGQQMQDMRLSSSAELFAALRAPDIALRLATLAAIAAHPGKALAFDSLGGRDLVDELIDILSMDQYSALRTATAAALFALPDSRSLEQACRIFQTESDLEVMMLAAHRIAREPVGMAVDYFLPFLYDPADWQRQRVAARMLAGCNGLQPAEQLRVVLLAGEAGAQPPRLAADTLPVWLEALQGAFACEARRLLMAQGETAFKILGENRAGLDAVTKSWLLAWGAASFRQQAVELILAALFEDDHDLQCSALEAVATYENEPVFQAALNQLSLDGGSKRWQVAAICAGVPIDNLQQRVFSEQDIDLRVALIQRLAHERQGMDKLIRLLEDDDWRMRAAAVDGLVEHGEPVAAAVIALLQHVDIAVRTAAAQVLIRLGKECLIAGLQSV